MRFVRPRAMSNRYGRFGKNVGWLREHVDPHAQELKGVGKLRYAYPLDKRMRGRLLGLSKPYRKVLNAFCNLALLSRVLLRSEW